jgi:hypothetical protein
MTGLRAHAFRLNSLVVVLIALACAIYALTLPLGELSRPGAGMWPLLISIAMGAAGVGLVVTEPDAEDYEPLTKRSLLTVIGFALMAAFIVAFTWVGLTLTVLVFSVVWLRWMARERWPLVVLASLGFTVVFVLVFSILLRVPMPHDPVISLLTGRGL